MEHGPVAACPGRGVLPQCKHEGGRARRWRAGGYCCVFPIKSQCCRWQALQVTGGGLHGGGLHRHGKGTRVRYGHDRTRSNDTAKAGGHLQTLENNTNSARVKAAGHLQGVSHRLLDLSLIHI